LRTVFDSLGRNVEPVITKYQSAFERPMEFLRRTLGVVLLVLFTVHPGFAWIHGSSLTSILGMNLAQVNYSTAEQPFLNIVKTATAWQTRNGGGSDTGEEVSLYQNCLDANGYPTTLTCLSNTFVAVSFEVFLNIGSSDLVGFPYRAGDYLLQWSGDANWSVTLDATVTCTTSPCKVTVASPSASGLKVTLTCTGTGCAGGHTLMSNLSLIYCSTYSGGRCSNGYDSLLATGEYFDPVFVKLIRPFKNLRFMDWMATIQNFQTNWSDRPIPGYVFWSGSRTNATINGASPDPNFGGISDGVPAEVMFALCNEIGSDCWFCMPPLATDTYVTNFATLAHSTLKAPQKAYVEYANELWNDGKLCPASGSMVTTCATQAAVICNNVLGSQCPYPASFSALQANTAWSAYQAAHLGALWQSAWGADSSRVVRVFGGQNGNPAYAQLFLAQTYPGFITGTVGANIDALAVAPYFTGQYQVPDAWTANGDGGLANLFADVETGIVPATLNSGNCGNGAGKTCDPVDSAHYTFTSGLSLPSTPTNGQLIAAQMNVTNTASSGQTFLAVDGGTSFPILLNDGGCPGNNVGAGTLQSGEQRVFAFTSAIAGCSGGSITAGWRAFALLPSVVGQINEVVGLTQLNCNYATSLGPGLLIGYESGQGFVTGDPVLQTLYVTAIRDARQAAVYNQAYTTIKNITGCKIGVFNHFNDIGAYTLTANFGWWASLENFQNTTSPEYGVLSTFH
jgi:hypothetical protein